MPPTTQTASLPSWQQVQQNLAAIFPHLVGSLVVLVLGIVLGVLVGRVTWRLLRRTDIDRRAANAGIASSLATVGVVSTARLLARLLQAFIIFSSTIVALYLLDWRLASGLAERFLLYVPHLAGGLLILAGGLIVSRFLSRAALIAAVNREIRSARMLSDLTRIGVMALTVAIAFEQAQIGQTTVLVAFAIVFGGLTLAAAIPLGLALRDVSARWLAEQFAPTRPEKTEHDVFQHW